MVENKEYAIIFWHQKYGLIELWEKMLRMGCDLFRFTIQAMKKGF